MTSSFLYFYLVAVSIPVVFVQRICCFFYSFLIRMRLSGKGSAFEIKIVFISSFKKINKLQYISIMCVSSALSVYSISDLLAVASRRSIINVSNRIDQKHNCYARSTQSQLLMAHVLILSTRLNSYLSNHCFYMKML